MIYEHRQNEQFFCFVFLLLSIAFIFALRCFRFGRPLILSWDRLMPHFIRHTINVIIFLLLLSLFLTFIFHFKWSCSFNELGHFSVTWYSGRWWKWNAYTQTLKCGNDLHIWNRELRMKIDRFYSGCEHTKMAQISI